MKRLPILTIFGIAMGWWEGVVVVYIRKILQMFVADLTGIVMEQVPPDLLFIERTREAATIIILVTIALLLEKKWLRRVATFLWVFAIWDIFYYITLKILINWPPSLSTIDCLFLIPCPLIAPVWAPLITMAGFLIVAGYILKKVN